MTLLLVSFLAGVLTIAAPCIFPLLPAIIGGTSTIDGDDRKNRPRPLIIIGSLLASLLIFTLLLRVSTVFLGVPPQVWQVLSGAIIAILGINYLWPKLWETVALKSGFYLGATRLFTSSSRRKGFAGDILLGASLGPVFTSCSPTYLYILAAILPKSFAEGLLYLTAYLVGLAAVLLLIGYSGQGIVSKLGWLANPKGTFIRVIGTMFIVLGLSIATGSIKKLETYVLDQGWYDPIGNFEQRLR